MPSSQQGAAPGTRDVVRELREHKRLIDILFRRLSNPPKAAAPVVSSGGIVGMAQVVSTDGTVLMRSGQVDLDYADVAYGAPSDPNAGGDGEGAVAVSSWLTVDGYRLILEPGWYIPVLYMMVRWSDVTDAPPAFGGPYMGGGWDSVHNDYGVHAAVKYNTAGTGGFIQIANYGPTFIPADGDLHAELRATGGTPTANSNPTLSRIVWNITKLG